ncbi:hypothetical protein [Ruminococcus sp.]|uniref:hypothetical protein n=1 Tax=Ruminococcus sp. TaxID=41978 RepID=UPI00258D8734|nr:hypothetical protein [Ruminococcus sp.]MEE3439943.1 hypothetical protein [Ruminococcus sp.]
MTKKCKKITGEFIHIFQYYPSIPYEVITGEPEASAEYCEVLQRSIETGVDETIERYGTKPPTSFELPDIYID